MSRFVIAGDDDEAPTAGFYAGHNDHIPTVGLLPRRPARTGFSDGTGHELLGFVLYGKHDDGSSPDPDEITLLQRLAHAAGIAYGNVESRRWRERATTLERALLSQPPSLST